MDKLRAHWKWLLGGAGFLLLVLLVGPFLIPVPPLEDTFPPEQLADPDSRFIEVEGIRVHYKQAGEGARALMLLHGFAASTFSWREVMTPLAEDATVVAYDRVAFGLTARPMPGDDSWPGYNPYTAEAQSRLAVGLLDALGIERAVLVGNSAGGTAAVQIALAYPERVEALILVSPAVYQGGGPPGAVATLLRAPQANHLGPLFVRQIRDWGIDFGRAAWHDPTRIPPDFWEGYLKPLQADNWDRALWELNRSRQNVNLSDQFDALTLPVLVITGDDDRIVPTALSIRLAYELPNAELVVIPACGHIPQEECPAAWLAAVAPFLDGLR